MAAEASRRPIEEILATQVVIKSLETLKAFADPLRVRLLLAMEEHPRTVKEVASLLDVPATRLYYHVKILEKAGLLHVARRRLVSGIEERSYETTAKSWTIDEPLLAQLVETGVLKALLDVVAAELAIALGDTSKRVGDPASSVPMLTFTRWFLSDQEVVEAQQRWQDMQEAYGASEPGEGRNEYHAFFATYRQPRGQ